MTRPAKRTQRAEVALYIKRQAWVLFILIAIAGLLDASWLQTEQLMVAKGVAIGALLSFVAQAIFASFVFRHTGYRARRNIVGQMYRGQMVKWLLTVVGFALIFIYIEPLSAPALFGGFIFMKLSHLVVLQRIR